MVVGIIVRVIVGVIMYTSSSPRFSFFDAFESGVFCCGLFDGASEICFQASFGRTRCGHGCMRSLLPDRFEHWGVFVL